MKRQAVLGDMNIPLLTLLTLTKDPDKVLAFAIYRETLLIKESNLVFYVMVQTGP